MKNAIIAIALLWGTIAWAQDDPPAIAAGDSVIYNEQRYIVIAEVGEAIFTEDADFSVRWSAAYVHTQARLEVVSWLTADFAKKDVVPPDDPALLLQKTFSQIAAAPTTTGLVLYRDEDDAPLVNIPIAQVVKIE